MGGKRPESPCQCLHWAKGSVQGKTSPRPREEPSSAWTKEKMEVSEGKTAIIAFSALYLT